MEKNRSNDDEDSSVNETFIKINDLQWESYKLDVQYLSQSLEWTWDDACDYAELFRKTIQFTLNYPGTDSNDFRVLTSDEKQRCRDIEKKYKVKPDFEVIRAFRKSRLSSDQA